MMDKICSVLVREEGVEVKKGGGFFAEDKLKISDLSVEVEGLGKLSLPVSLEDVKQLLIISSEAKVGIRDKTVLDKNVRDTNEIKKDQLAITFKGDALGSMLADMGKLMELSDDMKLVPHLHNMLIYTPGQFFKAHQDTEKLKGMVATLVIVLPVPHIGGDLVINHNCESYTFSSENIDSKAVKCLAFYADCYHEVNKVKSGHRITLTYNLVLESSRENEQGSVNNDLVGAVKEYFDTKKLTEYQIRNKESLKLVYFLNHSYTEHSLRWNMMKGVDRQNAMAFYATAKELDLVPYLALVEIQETWHAINGDDYYDYDRRRWSKRRQYDSEDLEALELQSLIDNRTMLNYWIDANNNEVAFDECSVSKDCICWIKGTKEFKPYDSEYEGYMGNYGETMDYWYRRAAVVLFKNTDSFLTNFGLNYENAFNELVNLTKSPGKEREVLELVEKVGVLLYGTSYGICNIRLNLLSKFVGIACYIQNKEVAKEILSHCKWEVLETNISQELVRLECLYGTEWCLQLLKSWMPKEISYYNMENIILKDIGSLLDKLLNAKVNNELIAFLFHTQVIALIGKDRYYNRLTPTELSENFKLRMIIVKNTIIAALIIGNIEELNKLIDHMIGNVKLYSVFDLADFCLEFRTYYAVEQKHLKRLEDYLLRVMEEEISLGLRAEDDYSIYASFFPYDTGKESGIVKQFLESKTEVKKVWPIAGPIRQRVKEMFKGLDLPVELSEEETGSPYKLVMVKKTDRLYRDARERYVKLQGYYQRLKVGVYAGVGVEL